MAKYTLTGIAIIFFFLVYNFLLAFGSLEGTPAARTGNPFFPYLTDKPLTEDGYYMLTVAWNIAEGKGFTYNNGIKTTGVQPLATLVYAVQALVVQRCGGDKYDFARAIIILSALLQVIFSFLVYKLAVNISKDPDKGLYFLVSVCVVLLNFKVLLNFANGLETGLYLILLSLFVLYLLKYKQIQPGIKNLVGLGFLSGLLLLCRLDSAVILFTFYFLLAFSKKLKVTQIVLIIIIALLMYLPWQLYVWDVTGNILQSSARSQTTVFVFNDLSFKTYHYFAALIQQLTPLLYTGNLRLWLMFPLGVLYVFALLFFFRKYRGQLISTYSYGIVKLFSISVVVLLVIYFFFSNAPYFFFRYFTFVTIISFPVFILLFVHLIKKLRPFYIYTIIVIVLAAFGIQGFLYLHSGRSPKGLTVRVEFVEKNFSKDMLVGSFQTGILGYYCDNVINLDGKMDNSALKSYSGKGVDHYMDSMQVDVLMEIEDFIPVFLQKDYLERYWEVYSKDIGDGETICYVRKKF